jgi:RNA polymerase-binding protein DksA
MAKKTKTAKKISGASKPARKVTKKAAKSTARKTARKAAPKKSAPKKAAAKKAAPKKAAAKKAAPKKAAPKKAARKKAATKTASKKTAAKKSSRRRPTGAEKEIQILASKLNEKRDEMVSLYRRDVGIGAAVSHDGEDEIDRANFDADRDLALALSSGEREVLFQIDEALAKIDRGEFGSCGSCGNAVGKERLRAIPWARYCIDCQELEEKGLLE